MDACLAGGIFVIAYALIASERFDRTLVALLGGLFVVALRVIDQQQAFAATDFNVIFRLAGSAASVWASLPWPHVMGALAVGAAPNEAEARESFQLVHVTAGSGGGQPRCAECRLPSRPPAMHAADAGDDANLAALATRIAAIAATTAMVPATFRAHRAGRVLRPALQRRCAVAARRTARCSRFGNGVHRSSPDRCVFCGQPIGPDEPAVGHGDSAAHATCADASLGDERLWDGIASAFGDDVPAMDGAGPTPDDRDRAKQPGHRSAAAGRTGCALLAVLLLAAALVAWQG